MNTLPNYPVARPRRLRFSPAMRQMVRETHLHPEDFILPLFVRHGQDVRQPIPSMPGQFQLSIDTLIEEAQRAWSLGIRSVILFGIPAHKDPLGSENYDPQGIVPQAISALKRTLPGLIVVSDLCMCEYTDHGHCGVINAPETAVSTRFCPKATCSTTPRCTTWAKPRSCTPGPARTSSRPAA